VLTARPALGAELTPILAAVIVPGSGEYVPFVRHWAGALAVTVGCPGEDLELAAAELFTNAVTHSRSGDTGGEATVIVAAAPGEAILHVHDQGGHNGQVPRMKARRAARSQESGRGLLIVEAISLHWAAGPAACCAQALPDDPAVTADGCCIWCHIRSGTAPACNTPEPQRGSPADATQACCPPLLTWAGPGVSLTTSPLRIRQAGRRLQVRQVMAHPARADVGAPTGRPPRPCGGGGGAGRRRAGHKVPAGQS
jgi:anti-sigma regulatory factor (Ser/Thr protein kinase)